MDSTSIEEKLEALTYNHFSFEIRRFPGFQNCLQKIMMSKFFDESSFALDDSPGQLKKYIFYILYKFLVEVTKQCIPSGMDMHCSKIYSLTRQSWQFWNLHVVKILNMPPKNQSDKKISKFIFCLGRIIRSIRKIYI